LGFIIHVPGDENPQGENNKQANEHPWIRSEVESGFHHTSVPFKPAGS
jgi:hypothetical protein